MITKTYMYTQFHDVTNRAPSPRLITLLSATLTAWRREVNLKVTASRVGHVQQQLYVLEMTYLVILSAAAARCDVDDDLAVAFQLSAYASMKQWFVLI